MQWKAIDRYSKDYIELQTKDNVKFYKTPDAILKRQLEIFDEVAKKKAGENPIFKEIIESQLGIREARDAVGAGYGRQPQDGVRSLLRTKREEANLTCGTKQAEHHSGNYGMVLCHSQQNDKRKK